MAHNLYHNIGEAFRHIREMLESEYGNREAGALAGLLLEHVTGLGRARLNLEAATQLSHGQQVLLEQALKRLLAGEPVQHILGTAHFYGREFLAGPEVLIPRQETEELVHWILSDYPNPPEHVLDIGTGSGCIAISLALEWHNRTRVMAIDISEKALSVARQNATHFEARVDFLCLDLFDASTHLFHDLDLIVSNPPYVTEKEKEDLAPRVRDHEPAMALFVPDGDPLRFYKRIAQLGRKWLKPNGCIYVEINESFGAATQDCFLEAGYSKTELRKDLNGRDRMLKAWV